MTSTDSSRGPRVSIGLPVYNGERYISETLDSLLAQTFQDFELIICDNASGDRTDQICRRYAAKDGRIRYFRNSTNLGAAKNYRLAFELATGEYFRWANCDDLFAPTSLECCVEVLDRELSVILSYPKTKLIDEWGHMISEYEDNLDIRSTKASERFIQVCERIGLINVCYGLVRANTLRKTRLIRSHPGGDIPLVAELALYGKFWEIPEFLFYRRLHSGATSSYKDNETKLQEFFDPNSVGHPSFRQWKTLLDHFGSVLRAPVEAGEKLLAVSHLIKTGIWARSKLTEEVVTGLRYLGRRVLSGL